MVWSEVPFFVIALKIVFDLDDQSLNNTLQTSFSFRANIEEPNGQGLPWMTSEYQGISEHVTCDILHVTCERK